MESKASHSMEITTDTENVINRIIFSYKTTTDNEFLVAIKKGMQVHS